MLSCWGMLLNMFVVLQYHFALSFGHGIVKRVVGHVGYVYT